MSKNRLLVSRQRRPDHASAVSHSVSLSCGCSKPPSWLRVARINIAPSVVEAFVIVERCGPEDRISRMERVWATMSAGAPSEAIQSRGMGVPRQC